METFETIRYEVADHIATLTLSRPERLNAANPLMLRELISAFDLSDADPDVRAVIVSGEGRAFCAGFELDSPQAFALDCDEIGWEDLDPDHPIRDVGGCLVLRIFESLKPVIGAVNGAAVGIGATMLLPMDIRVGADVARIGFVFARRGIVPDGAAGWFLPRVVGIGNALDWTLTGRLVGATEASQAGLLQAVHPASELLSAARAIAQEIVTRVSPVSATLARHMLWRGLGVDHPMEMHRLDSRLMAARGAHADSNEGVASFLEKRPAAFPGTVPADLPAIFPWWSERQFR